MKTNVAGRLLPVLVLFGLSACGQDEPATDIEIAEDTPAAYSGQFTEGTHFDRLEPPQPTVGDASMVEVSEVFWYGCHHCASLEPELNRWVAEAPDNVRFVRIPATWNQTAATHAQIYYTLEVLAENGTIADGEAVHAAVFEAIHARGNRLLRDEDIRGFFAEFGVDAGEFNRTWSSPEVANLLRSANELARNYRIDSVPTIVINGEYRTSKYMAGDELFNVVDDLIAQ